MASINRYITCTIPVQQPKLSWKHTTIMIISNSSLGNYLIGLPTNIQLNYFFSVTPQNQANMKHVIDTFNCVEDCPIFSDMYDFCRMYAGASLAAARKLCAGTTDIAINWSGGLHHAKKGEASGFCYVNDIVLAILELLRCIIHISVELKMLY